MASSFFPTLLLFGLFFMPFIPPHLITVVQGMIKKTKPSLYMQLFLQFVFSFFQEVDYPKMRFLFWYFPDYRRNILYYVELIKTWFHFQCNRSLIFCEWNFWILTPNFKKIIWFCKWCNFFKNIIYLSVAMVKQIFFAKVDKHAHILSLLENVMSSLFSWVNTIEYTITPFGIDIP